MSNPLLARIYDAVLAPTEWMGVRDQRRRLMDGLSGRVVEFGAGTGLNVPLYPASAREVHVLEPDEQYRVRLRASLERESLPTPLRLLAYFSSSWRLSSDWTTWPLQR